MRNVKHVLAMIMMFAVIVSIASVPASAATSDFFHFPLVTESMGNGYMAAAVAVQRFLMLYDTTYSYRISKSGGTDGYFGATSAAVTKDFQTKNGLTADGKVGSYTWLMIESCLTETGVDSVGPVYAWGTASKNASNWVIVYLDGYKACTDKNTLTVSFYS